MKITKFLLAIAIASVSLFSSCSDDDDKAEKKLTEKESLEFNNHRELDYLVKVTDKLFIDASNLHDSWVDTYLAEFLELDKASATDLLIEGIVGIASEVGAEKIAGPFESGNVLQVESWYSWNSLTDFKNNIRSIENSYKGGYYEATRGASLESYFAKKNPVLNEKVVKAIDDAIASLDLIPEPFRNQLETASSKSLIENAIAKCAVVESLFRGEIKTAVVKDRKDYDFTEIAKVYAEKTIVPTYKEMTDGAKELVAAVKAFKETKSQEDLDKACAAWKKTRLAWERSEAFLFGPAKSKNLDPALDSWPLDKTQLDGILKGSVSIDKIQLAYLTSGFHTLEYLLFREGKNRTTKF